MTDNNPIQPFDLGQPAADAQANAELDAAILRQVGAHPLRTHGEVADGPAFWNHDGVLIHGEPLTYTNVIGQAAEAPRMLDDETQWVAAPRQGPPVDLDVVARELNLDDGIGEIAAPNIFARQQSIPLEIPSAVAVVGVGGVGSWIGLMLALAGVPDLWLFDSDTVSEHNLNRTPYGPDAIDKPKTEALKALIATLRPRCKVRCHPNFDRKFAETLGLSGTDFSWLAISTDTWNSRKAAHQWAAHQGVSYLEAAAEGEVGSISNCPAEWATADEANPGYASVPVWVGPATCAAWMACNHILHSRGVPDSARMGWSHDRINFTYHERS